MRFAIAIVLLGVGLTVTAAAQTPPAAPAITRTVVAGTKLPSLGNTSLYFRAASVSIPAGQKISLSGPSGILYQLSGSTEVSAGETKTITGGEGVLIAGGTTAALSAGNGEQSTLLYFLLAPKEPLDQPVAFAPATVKELYRTVAPLPELKPGSLVHQWGKPAPRNNEFQVISYDRESTGGLQCRVTQSEKSSSTCSARSG